MALRKIGKLNFYRKKRYPNGVLLTTDHASWLFLTNKEYRQLVSGEVDEKLFIRLEDKGIIITEDNSLRTSQKYIDYQQQVFRGTSLHIVVPTIRCNQTCIYCYALRKPPETKGVDMDTATAKSVVDFIFQSPSPVITLEFTGGEPLLNYPIVKYMIEYAEKLNEKYDKDIEYAVVTNGTLLTDEIVKFLGEHDVGICISLDGPAELHNRHRKFYDNAPTYDKVEYWIKKLTDENYKHLNVLPVVTHYTMGYWKELIDTVRGLGFSTFRLKYMACFGFARGVWEKIGYTPEEYLEFWKNSINYMLELNRKGIMMRDGMATILLKKIFTGDNAFFAEMNAPCGAVTGQMVYNYNGDIFPCDEARVFPEFKLGNVRENTRKEVISHPTACSMINISSNLSLLCDSCSWFPFCGLCPLQAYSMSGSLVTKLPFDIKCKMHKGMLDFLFEKILTSPEERRLLEAWLDYPEVA